MLSDETGAVEGRAVPSFLFLQGLAYGLAQIRHSFSYSFGDSYDVIHLFDHSFVHSFIQSTIVQLSLSSRPCARSALEMLGQRKDMAPALQGLTL